MLKKFSQKVFKSFDKKFFWMAIKVFVPIILAGIVQAAVYFVDNIIVAGTDVHDDIAKGLTQIDLAAVGAGNEIFLMMTSFGMAATILFGILYSQFSDKQRDFAETFKLNIWFVTFITIIIALISFFYADDLISLFFHNNAGEQKDLVVKHGGNFVKISTISLVFFNLSVNIINPMTIKGKVKYGLYLSLVALVLNVVLDILFIYGFDMGAEGSSYATAIAFFVEFLIAIYLMIRNKKWFKGAWNLFIIHKRIFIELGKRFMIFLFFVLMECAFVVATILFSSLYGDTYLRGMTVGYIIVNLLFVNISATSKGVSIFIGPLLGRGRMKEAKEMSKKLIYPNIFLALISMVVAGIINTFFPILMLDKSNEVWDAQWLIISFIIAFPAFIGVRYFSTTFEVGGMQWVPNFWNRGFQLWAVIPLIIVMSPLALDVSWHWSIFAMANSIYIPFFVIIYKYSKFKWLRQIKTD